MNIKANNATESHGAVKATIIAEGFVIGTVTLRLTERCNCVIWSDAYWADRGVISWLAKHGEAFDVIVDQLENAVTAAYRKTLTRPLHEGREAAATDPNALCPYAGDKRELWFAGFLAQLDEQMSEVADG